MVKIAGTNLEIDKFEVSKEQCPKKSGIKYFI